ncbi:hypothetical protein [Mycobacterium europaeum]|uniref:hypothetical protein n=1 Tax=Mycobacterium europaeum TaxID=761804 RepID=UPI000B86B31D|nr:hypothetical protein [Mycobacterium europaeum]
MFSKRLSGLWIVGAAGLGDAEPGDDDVGGQLDVVDGFQWAFNRAEPVREWAEGERRGGAVGDEEQQRSRWHGSEHAGVGEPVQGLP